MYTRLICAVLAVLLLLLPAAPAFAQDEPIPIMPPVLCGDLSEEDCAILEKATAAAYDLTSYAAEMAFDFSVSGIPDLPVDPLAFSFQMGGRFAFDEVGQEVMQRMTQMQSDITEGDLQELMEDMPDLMIDLYRGMNFDMTMAYTVPAAVAAAISDDSDTEFPESMSFDMRMIDGMMYMNIGALREFIPETDDTFTSDWIGIDYVGMLEMQLERSDAFDSDAMAAGMMGGLAFSQMMQRMQDFVTVERLDDVDLDGQQGAVFAYTADVVGFLTSSLFTEMVDQMLAQVAAQAGEDESSMQEVRDGAAMISFMAPMLFRDLQITSQTTVGLDDFMTYASEFNINWDLSSLMQFAAMTDPELADVVSGLEPMIDVGFTMTMGEFDADMTFEAPEDVQLIPLEELMPPDTSAVF